MPANEQTWRDQKLLHLAFGVTSIVMLLSTIWMLAKDHNREWKVYQRKFRNLEAYTADARLSEQESADYYARRKDLQHKLEVARSEAPPRDVVDAFVREAQSKKDDPKLAERYPYRLDRIETAYAALEEAERTARSPSGTKDDEAGEDGVYESKRKKLIKKRDDLISAMQDVQARAKQVEDNRQRDLKFKRADLDGVRSQYDIGVNEGLDEAELEKIEKRVKDFELQISGSDTAYGLLPAAQDAKTHREKLQTLLEQAIADETAARKALADHEADAKRLETALAERADTARKRMLELPIIDAFGRPLKVDNIWLPQLTWNNNFRDVARFDRCTTCHQGIDKTAPGSAVDAGYPTTRRLVLTLATPSAAPELTDAQIDRLADMQQEAQNAWFYERAEKEAAVPEQKLQYRLAQAYGLELGKQGTFAPNDVTVTVVEPKSSAAKALLEPGDVIEQINDVKLLDRKRAVLYLLDSVVWGQPLTLHVRRGTPEPFN